MEKISQIVHASSRIPPIDVKNTPPVRPGVPTFGRPVGESPPTFTGERQALTRSSTETRFGGEVGRGGSTTGSDEEPKPGVGAAAPKAGTKPGAVGAGPAEAESGAGAEAASHSPPEAVSRRPVEKPLVSPRELGYEPTHGLVIADLTEREASPMPMGPKPRGSFLDIRA